MSKLLNNSRNDELLCTAKAAINDEWKSFVIGLAYCYISSVNIGLTTHEHTIERCISDLTYTLTQVMLDIIPILLDIEDRNIIVGI